MRAVQLKMARAALGVTVRLLALETKISTVTITHYETTDSAKYVTVAALRKYFEDRGIEFVNDNSIRVREKVLA